jgi:uncharacterized membrane protein YfcA
MSMLWLVGAFGVFIAHFVFGLAGFGVGLVAMAVLPFVMSPASAIVLLTVYAFLFAVVIFIPVRRDFMPGAIAGLLVGTVIGTPAGVYILAVAPASVVDRLIGAMLVVVVVLEFAGRMPRRLEGRGWSVGAGVLAGLTGGAVGLPGPPLIVYAATQPWSPRAFKANVQAFFVVNQGAILVGYWMAGLLDREVARLSVVYLAPAVAGIALGMALFNRVDPVRFRRIVFALLLVSGVVLLVFG